jgi:hypothetical protein
MTPEQIAELGKQFGAQTAEKIREASDKAELSLNTKMDEVKKGIVKMEDFEKFKTDTMAPLQEQLKSLETIAKDQGDKINQMLEKAPANSKSFEQFIEEKKDVLKDLFASGKMVQFTGAELKAAGITSIGGSVNPQSNVPTSPYAPGIGGADLEIFDIARNPNFITNRIDLGRTDTSRLAWINEVDYQGLPGQVLEAGTKPLTQHKFQVELSQAKKIASYIQLTEEFQDDLPGLATTVRRMLQNDVIREWDNAIQKDVQDNSRAFNITGFNGKVFDSTMYDAIGAMLAQVGFYNFQANGIFMNPIELWRTFMSKDTQGRYLLPPFMDRINPLLAEANKVALGFAMVGDFKQYKVDIYKDFVLKMGWINDDLIKNQFSIVGEIRYHSYISDARKNALVYNDIDYIKTTINGTPTS